MQALPLRGRAATTLPVFGNLANRYAKRPCRRERKCPEALVYYYCVGFAGLDTESVGTIAASVYPRDTCAVAPVRHPAASGGGSDVASSGQGQLVSDCSQLRSPANRVPVVVARRLPHW